MFSGEDSSEIRAALKRAANPDCLQCGGAGFETMMESDVPRVGWANLSALRVLDMLGIDSDPGSTGMLTLPEARRTVMRGRARSKQFVARLCYESFSDGRFHSGGLDEDSLRQRVEQFASFVEQAAERGATTIYWA